MASTGRTFRRAFVTGASGFLGWQIAHQLVQADVAVAALSRSGMLPGDLEGRGVAVVRGGLDDPDLLASAMDGCDLVFHVAADVSMWRKRWAASVATNVLGTRNVVSAALEAGVRRLVFTSTAATIGKPLSPGPRSDLRILDESHEYNLHSLEMVYPHTKWLAEQEVRHGLNRGLDAVITHPAAVFGPGDWKGNTLPLFRGPRHGLSVAVPGGFRTVCDIRDVAQGHLLAATAGRAGDGYILAGQAMSVAELFGLIADEVGGLRPRWELPDRFVHGLGRFMDALADVTDRRPLLSWEMAWQSTLRVGLSSAKAERELGYSCRPPRESIHDGAAWFRARDLL
ncbi:MAG: NAD-dependent epimerase/dehydratase family protein [Deltaproteobacteria bacterium]|jgi:dihydroflavonol-4-reductase|nr:NAD-dependent epimerase/dehydratase family protein [Deltaproteobacteria bacterium]MBW2534972.1 NAD-dependent epimerase/dehydratase family protein [Deltaproteobacteria bacterium]